MEKKQVEVTPENMSRVLGKQALQQNILSARILGEIVKSTLGPKGMDKMLVDNQGRITITNDGATILEDMQIDQPAAKIIADISKTQEKEIGDGTTTVAMLTGKLLENAQDLIDDGIHATKIIKGYNLAASMILKELENLCIDFDKKSQKEILKKIAMTAMTGKGAEGNRERLADLIIESIGKLKKEKEIDKDNIRVSGISGSADQTELIEGVVLNKQIQLDTMPTRFENPKIMLLDCELEVKHPEMDATIQINNPADLQAFMQNEKMMVAKWAEKIIGSGANVVFCAKGIADQMQHFLANKGIMAIRRVNKYDMEDIARATKAVIITDIEEIGDNVFGTAGLIEQIKKSDQYRILIRDCEGAKMNTILISGTTHYAIDEVIRAFSDGLGDVIAVIKDEKVVPGGGAIEIEMARILRNYATKQGGREQLAIEKFADALEFVPRTLAENAGMDPIDVLTELKKAHDNGKTNIGLNLFKEDISDVIEAGIVEPMKIKTQAIQAATEVATMVLRIDDILVSNKG